LVDAIEEAYSTENQARDDDDDDDDDDGGDERCGGVAGKAGFLKKGKARNESLSENLWKIQGNFETKS
jgi:hypothetical protein